MIAGFRTQLLISWCVLALLLTSVPARADNFSTYAPAPSFSFPGATVAFDALADGRLVAAVAADIYRETSPGSRSFTKLGTLAGADFSEFGAAFLRVSPSGSSIAVGNNGGSSFSNYQVGVFALATLSGQWFAASHSDGAWIDDRYIALTAASPNDASSVVTALDRLSLSPTTPVNRTIIANIQGASGGVAFDANGNLFTGNGFMNSGPSQTGYIYAFPPSLYVPAITAGAPANFETQGIHIVDLLSAATLAFDGQGNLVVGGGDGFGSSSDSNYFAIVRASAIAAALAGNAFIDTSPAAGNVRKFDPDPSDGTFYTVRVNRSRREVYGSGFGSSTTYTLKAPAAVPLPTWSIELFAAVLALVGVALKRRSFAVTSARAHLAHG